MNVNEMLKNKKVLISDGALGTELIKKGLPPGYCPELWNVENPSAIQAVAVAYAQAGSNIVLTNTFGGTDIKLQKYALENRTEELNKSGVEIVKQALKNTGVLVFGSIGPSGEFMEPLGTITEEQMAQSFARQVKAMVQAGVDGLVFETFMDLSEALCGLKAAKKITNLPVVVSLTYNKSDKGFATMMGVTPERAVKELTENGADMIGANCGLKADVMIELTKIFRSHTNLPLWIKPNAGAPENEAGRTVYKETPETMAKSIQEVIKAGANVVGGCCGSTPEHIKAISKIAK
ncbi:MAG: hypothetical protein A2252_02200 [Elusimicrobia bacterium RIFOXYA2_FULL_39_19]|nr:MAG: hypothetical protein A2252_02200 [Elusimicrobia bacterium RIFOXYA2_FULL_39_19]